MPHDEFIALMESVNRLITKTYQAEEDTFYNISKESAGLLKTVEVDLSLACDHMGDDSA